MDAERALISKIISTGQLEEAISKGIDVEHFADLECRRMFDFLIEHTRRYKSPPSMAVVKEEMPDFEWVHIQDPLDYLIDRFIKLVKRRYAQDMVVELAKACDDPERSENIDMEFLEVARSLATLVPSSQVARFSDMDKRISEYEAMKEQGEKPGIPFGFPSLDRWTGGIQPHELVTVSGFSGLGKSTMLLRIAFNAWVEGYTPLFISLEMEARTILRRFDAMAAGLDYTALKQLDLPEESLASWRETAEKIRKKSQDIPVIDSIRGCTPEHIFAETVRHKPDLVVVDYIGLMRSGRAGQRTSALWQTITEITQDLKQNARTLKIPILVAAQTNRSGARDGAELDNIGQSISIVQDSDIVIGLSGFDEDGVDLSERKEMEVRLQKNRDGRLGRFLSIWNHEKQLYREKTFRDYRKRDQESGDEKEMAHAGDAG